MVQNIAPPPNAVITIQPLATPVGSQDNTPPVLQGLSNGTLIEGFVVNRDAQQNPILRTSIGDILVKSDMFLKTGSEVVIRVDTQVESRARIISIDGMTPQDYVAKAIPTPPAGDEILSSSLLASAKPVVSAPQASGSQAPVILTAVLLSPNVLVSEGMPPQIAQYWSQIMASLQKDASLMLKIIKTELPLPNDPVVPAQSAIAPASTAPTVAAKQPVIPQPSPLPNAQSAPLPVSPPANSQPVMPPPSPLQAQHVVAPASVVQHHVSTIAAPLPQQQTATVITADTPSPAAAKPATPLPAGTAPYPASPATQSVPAQGQPAPLSSPQAPAPQMQAHVIGHEFDGANIIQTPVGTFKLLTAKPLPTGSKLTVEVAPESRPTITAPPAPLLPTDLDEFTLLARDWSSMRDAISTIAAQDPQLAAQIIQSSLPKPHAKLSSEMLFLFAAIKSGTPEQWFGKRAIEILDMRSPEILKRLKGDFAQLQQVFSDALPQWNSVIVPFYSDSQLQQIRMFFRHDDESGGKSQSGGGQRFIIELDLSHLGDMQLDGFIKQSNKGKHFDLIVRTARHLPGEVEQGIRALFEQSMQITGYKGYVNFQQGSHLFVRPLESVKEALMADGKTIIA